MPLDSRPTLPARAGIPMNSDPAQLLAVFAGAGAYFLVIGDSSIHDHRRSDPQMVQSHIAAEGSAKRWMHNMTRRKRDSAEKCNYCSI